MHHPVDWLNQTDRELAKKRISTDFHFWLHGHEHQSWVVPSQSNITIAAGAVGAQASEEFGVNLVRLDLAACAGTVHLHQRRAGGTSWTIAPVEVHAPEGRWVIESLPSELRKLIPAAPPPVKTLPVPHESIPAFKTKKLFGREALIKEALDKLNRQPFLLVYGLRGNGKSSIIRELEKQAPLVSKESKIFFRADRFTSADQLFCQFAVPLGEGAEFPRAPQGDPQTIATYILRRYPNPQSAWIWIDRAHLLLEGNGFRDPKIYNLLRGLHIALGKQWHFLLELRERPPKGLFLDYSCECEVPGLDKQSLADWLHDEAPTDQKDVWIYDGKKLKSIYQWLGGGHGNQAHPQAIELLILVAQERNETPFAVLKRHRDSVEEKIEEKLLGDLYYHVLNDAEQCLLQALALYRTAIPHDHADALEHHLNIPDAWDGIDRRCLLAASPDHRDYFLHSFIAGWVRTRCLGYAGHGEDDHADFLQSTPNDVRNHARDLHAAVATCWLEHPRISRRATNLNIARALEAFHHLVSAGDSARVQEIAVKLLTGNLPWALQRIKSLDDYLFKIKAPIPRQLEVLQYWAALDPDDHMVQRFLGECWQKEEGRKSQKALECFEKACRLRPDFPQYWANLGKALLAQGREGATVFLARLEQLEQDCPKAIDDHVRAVQADCYTLLGDNVQAAAVRMARINVGSQNPAFYNDVAKARLAGGDCVGALDVLDLAVKNDCADEHTEAIRAEVLQGYNPEQAAAMRMEKINAGNCDAAFYNDEAQARHKAGNISGALEILDLAAKNGCADEYTEAIRAAVLQEHDPQQAAAIRMAKIKAGSRNSAFYNDEAKARRAVGDSSGALEILDLADKSRCADKYTEAIRASILQKTDESTAKATVVRMSNADFYNNEAQRLYKRGDSSGALELLNLAVKNGCADEQTKKIRSKILQKSKRLNV